jgi:malonate transporter and related proteins
VPGAVSGFIVIWTVTLTGYLIGRCDLLGPHGTTVLARLVFFAAAPTLLIAMTDRSGLLAMVFVPSRVLTRRVR